VQLRAAAGVTAGLAFLTFVPTLRGVSLSVIYTMPPSEMLISMFRLRMRYRYGMATLTLTARLREDAFLLPSRDRVGLRLNLICAVYASCNDSEKITAVRPVVIIGM
jgi:hypothetical protein